MKIIEFVFKEDYWKRLGMPGPNHFFLVPGTNEFRNFGYGRYSEIKEGGRFDGRMVMSQMKKKNIIVLNFIEDGE